MTESVSSSGPPASADTSVTPTSRRSVARPPGTGTSSATCRLWGGVGGVAGWRKPKQAARLQRAVDRLQASAQPAPPSASTGQHQRRTWCATPGCAAKRAMSSAALPMVAGGLEELRGSGACAGSRRGRRAQGCMMVTERWDGCAVALAMSCCCCVLPTASDAAAASSNTMPASIAHPPTCSLNSYALGSYPAPARTSVAIWLSSSDQATAPGWGGVG